MSDEKLALTVPPVRDLAQTGAQRKIVEEMVGASLKISRTSSSIVSAPIPKFRIANQELCAPDYRQVLLWAQDMRLEPSLVVERLLALPAKEADGPTPTQIVDGRFIKIGWDMALLPLESFEWVDGLLIEEIAFFVPEGHEVVAKTLVPPLPELRILKCQNMGVVILDLSLSPKLTELNCRGNYIGELDLLAVPNLIVLDCRDNEIRKISFPKASQLTSISCCRNQLCDLDLTNVSQLKTLFCLSNAITSIDLTGLSLLNGLFCSDNQLTKIDLSSVPQLEALYCDGNRLTEINLSSVHQLKALTLGGNPITKLDLSFVPLLAMLFCGATLLTQLDLSCVPNLGCLLCKNIHLRSLDIRELKALEILEYAPEHTRLIQRPDQHF